MNVRQHFDRPPSARGLATGLLTAAVALGVGQLVAGITDPSGAPVDEVGQLQIDLTPPALKNFAISAFGSNDKTVLLGGIYLVLAVFAAVIGVLAVRRLAYGMAGLAVFGAIGLVAVATRPKMSAADFLPTLAAVGAGAIALRALTSAAASRPTGPALPARKTPETARAGPGGSAPAPAGPPVGSGQAGGPVLPAGPGVPGGPGRRRFLGVTAAAAGAAVATGLGGRLLAERFSVASAQASLRLPRAAVPAPPLPPGADLSIPGLSSFITPNSSFYRVDTAIVLPEVAPSSWQLRIHGMVAREITLSFGELLRRPLIEDYITLCCVSNPVGGPYIGNALWLGASLAKLLREAGIRAGASQLLCTSSDGFTSGAPVRTVMDGRDALLAVGMNGKPLPVAHGFPVRMVVPGLYGYVSACKWLTDIEVTTYQAARAYWAQRGWSQQAPIKTESRIDVPSGSRQLSPGRVSVAGVAWAQHKGIEAVEARVDRGPWHPARLAAVPDIDTWRQWVWEWDATPGTHLIEARATDKTGYTQTAAQAPPEPNGATGYPSVTVSVGS
jgi:DMSO/TMAO reductase YedYZ molybdopterin-dependent catalytic subunit